MIAVVVRVTCSACGRFAHGTAPLGWTTMQRIEALELDEPGWQMHTTASTPEDESAPSTYDRRVLCPRHRARFGQEFTGPRAVSVVALGFPPTDAEPEARVTGIIESGRTEEG